MKVGLDASPLVEQAGGIQRYTVELTRALKLHFPEDCYHLMPDEGGRWWSWGLPRRLAREGFDLFHGTDFAAPYWPVCPSVVTVHDLSPWRAEFAAATSRRVRRRTPWLLRFGLATMVITPSEAVRREAIDQFGLSPEEVVAIPEAAAEHFRPAPTVTPRRPYFLFAGKAGVRKNVAVIESAVRELRRRWDVELLITGGAVADEELPGMYSGATAVLYPSLYEGFGLPVLEAMQCGTPVIASRDAAVMEVSRGACLHADAHDVMAWVEQMELVLTRADVGARLRASSLARAAQFSWKRTAMLTREVYRTAMRRFHG